MIFSFNVESGESASMSSCDFNIGVSGWTRDKMIWHPKSVCLDGIRWAVLARAFNSIYPSPGKEMTRVKINNDSK